MKRHRCIEWQCVMQSFLMTTGSLLSKNKRSSSLPAVKRLLAADGEGGMAAGLSERRKTEAAAVLVREKPSEVMQFFDLCTALIKGLAQ